MAAADFGGSGGGRCRGATRAVAELASAVANSSEAQRSGVREAAAQRLGVQGAPGWLIKGRQQRLAGGGSRVRVGEDSSSATPVMLVAAARAGSAGPLVQSGNEHLF